jgi:hypothetical protein
LKPEATEVKVDDYVVDLTIENGSNASLWRHNLRPRLLQEFWRFDECSSLREGCWVQDF